MLFNLYSHSLRILAIHSPFRVIFLNCNYDGAPSLGVYSGQKLLFRLIDWADIYQRVQQKCEMAVKCLVSVLIHLDNCHTGH